MYHLTRGVLALMIGFIISIVTGVIIVPLLRKIKAKQTLSTYLFKKHKEMLKSSSNIVSFIDDFTWLSDYEYQDYNETWRIFGKFFTSIEDMPKENSIQKAYATIIERGEKTGGAEGVFFL